MPENLSFSFFKQQLAIDVVNKELAQFAIYGMFHIAVRRQVMYL
jgi:hypothetical protein